MTSEEKRKLDTYFGFLQKMKALRVGEKLEEALYDRKLSVVLITKECSLKNEEKLREQGKERKDVTFFRYDGSYPIALACGYEKLKAVGLVDEHLGKAVLSILQNDKPEEK